MIVSASWVLTILGIVGMLGAARSLPWGWLVAFTAQPMWIVYSLLSKQWGFIPGCFIYAVVDVIGFRRALVHPAVPMVTASRQPATSSDEPLWLHLGAEGPQLSLVEPGMRSIDVSFGRDQPSRSIWKENSKCASLLNQPSFPSTA
jgi:hypothetical protein